MLSLFKIILILWKRSKNNNYGHSLSDSGLQSEPIKSSSLIEKSDFRAWTGKLPKWNCEISWKPWNSWYRVQSNQDRTWNHQKIQWESRWLGQNQVWTRRNEAKVENFRKFRILTGTGKFFWFFQELYQIKVFLKYYYISFCRRLLRSADITLESGINVALRKFVKKNKRSPIYTLYFYYLK